MDPLTSPIYDCIVVGSGPAGVMCAQTLVEAGKTVLMIDAGTDDVAEQPDWNYSYDEIRRKSDEQASIFLGRDMELLNLDSEKAFGQATPQRRYVTDRIKNVSPVIASEFALLESFSSGGLGNAWGLGCFTFSDAELTRAKLDHHKIRKAYDVIAKRIGISYSADDLHAYIADGLTSLQPGIHLDDNARAILKRYHHKRRQINDQHFYIGTPPLALLTQPVNNRQATGYSNMDFYYNFGWSAYRPSVTIKHLLGFSSFVHQRGVIVLRLDEHDNIVQVSGKDVKTGTLLNFYAKTIVLACNVAGTARIVIRSIGNGRTRVPLLSNAYSILTTIQWRQLGKLPSNNKTSTAQLCMIHDEDGQNVNIPMASLYSYSSLMLFRLIKKLPLNFKDSIRMLQYLHPALVIAGIHHPSSSSGTQNAELKDDDTLVINGPESADVKQMKLTERRFAKVLNQLGCIPAKKITPPPGSSAHYAGTLPFGDDNSSLCLSTTGLLAGTRNVYVADASGFHYLPAKGPTLTIMANAHNIALNVLKHE